MTMAPDRPPVALSEAMASETLTALRRARARVERARADRDRLVVQAHAEGASLRTIGDAAGLSHVGVAKLLARLAEDVDADLDV